MTSTYCSTFGVERKALCSTQSTVTPEGPKSSGQGASEHLDREPPFGHYKRAWKDVDCTVSSTRRTCSYLAATHEASCKVANGTQAVAHVPEACATVLTINDLPTDVLATILQKTLHPQFPGSVWGKNLHPAVHEARWFLMDGRNQSHRVLDKFPQDSCTASAQTCHVMCIASVCKRWKRIIYGEEGPGVVEHVAITGSRMAIRLPRTVKTLFIHGQMTDPMWRLVAKNGLAQLEAILTMRSRRSSNFLSKLVASCPSLKHIGIASPAEGSEGLHRRDLIQIAKLQDLRVLEMVDCDVPSTIAPLGGASGLRRLTLRCCGGVTGEDLNAFSSLKSLQLLVVEALDVGIEGFQAIANLPDLRSLTLTSCDGIERAGLEAVSALQHLRYLDISDVWEFAGDTLHPLASLTNLEVLALTDCENLQSSHLSVLRWLNQLKSLDLSRCARIDAHGIRHLTHLSGLSALSLQGCESVDSRAMKYFRELTSLQRLNLTGCRGVQTSALRHLRHLSALEVLSIADLVRVGNGAVKFLCALQNLRTLYVAGCPHITEEGLHLLRNHPVHVYT